MHPCAHGKDTTAIFPRRLLCWSLCLGDDSAGESRDWGSERGRGFGGFAPDGYSRIPGGDGGTWISH